MGNPKEPKGGESMRGVEEMTRVEGIQIIGELLEQAAKLAPKYPPLTTYKITYGNGMTTVTSMAAGITLDEARAYYIGQWFDLGINDREDMQQAVDVEEI